MKQLVLFNGPPGCGKDTAVDHLWAVNPHAFRFKLSGPIKAAIKAFFDLSDTDVVMLERVKDEPHDLLFGQTYREVQISFSEQWAKEYFGPRIFGNLAMRRIRKSPSMLFLCSDSGFDYEALPMVASIGHENTLLVRLHRKGHDFKNDSRSYITLNGVLTMDLTNSGTLADFYQQLDTAVGVWLDRSES